MNHRVSKFTCLLLALLMVCTLLPATVFASDGWTTSKPSGSIVSVYGTTTTYGDENKAILSGPLYKSKWYYQVSPKKDTNNTSFRIPQVSELFTIAEGWELKYVSVTGNSSGNRQPGASFLLASSGGSMVYYFEKTAPTYYSYTVNHVYRTNGGQDGTYTQSIEAEAGTTVYASNITKRTTYNNNTYTYTSATPTSAKITGNGTTFTLYYDRTVETKPDAPTSGEVTELLNNAVKVDCTNETANHADKTYGLINESFSIGTVEGNANSGYTVKVTVSPAKYVDAYSVDTGVTHTLAPDAQGSKTITLKYESGAWKVDSTIPVTFTVVCETVVPVPTPPNQPSEDDVITALTGVKVECDANEDHKQEYEVLEGSFTVGDVTGEGTTAAPYAVTVTVKAEKYVEKFNNEFSETTHEILGAGTGTITLKFVGGNWVVDGTPDVTFTVQEKPEKPSEDDIIKIWGSAYHFVMVSCTNSNVQHGRHFFATPKKGTFTVGDVQKDGDGNYTVDVTVDPTYYVNYYSNHRKCQHVLSPESQNNVITMTYDAETQSWPIPKTYSVAFTTVCVPEPEKPTFEQISERLFVEFNCTNAPSHSVYFKEEPFTADEHGVYKGKLIEDGTTASDVEWDAALGAWVCDVTVDAKPYCEVMDEGGDLRHSFAGSQSPTEIVKMRYTPSSAKPWSVVPEQRMVIQDDVVYLIEFNVTCEESTPAAPAVANVGLGSITLVCDRVSAHDKRFEVIESSVQIGKVQQNEEGLYTCEVTVQAAPYLAELNKTNPVHRLANGESGQASWTLYFRNGIWVSDIGALSSGMKVRHISFRVICDAAAPVYPKEYCYIDATATGGGSISPRGTVRVPVYDDQTFYMLAEPGYALVDVLVDGVSVGAVGSYTFRSVSRHHTIHAVFQPLSALPPQTGGDSTAVLFLGMGLILTACAAFVCLHRRKEN